MAGVLVKFLEVKARYATADKPCITHNALTTFVFLGPKGLKATAELFYIRAYLPAAISF